MSTSNTNFLQAAGFRIVINRQRFPNLEYFVQSVNHPSVDVPEAQASYSRISQIQQIGDKLEYAPVTFNLMLDEGMTAYTEMYDWMKRLVEEKYASATDDALSSEHDISLLILNSSNTLERTIVYHDAFPISMGEITMESTAGEPAVIIIPVTFRYTYFELR